MLVNSVTSAKPQVYTYLLRPLGQAHCRTPTSDEGSLIACSSDTSLAEELAANSLMRRSPQYKGLSSSCNGASAVTGYELQLVMEYCPTVGGLEA